MPLQNKQSTKQKTPTLKVLSINCYSLISDKRHAFLSNLLLDHKPEILCICESKLDNVPSVTLQFYQKILDMRSVIEKTINLVQEEY